MTITQSHNNTYPWWPDVSRQLMQVRAQHDAPLSFQALRQEVTALTQQNRDIHEHLCLNLNPATNIMNPEAEALLAAGLGSRPSLGYPGAKYEMGLEAIEQLELLTATLARTLFSAHYAEFRVASGAMANLYAFMATCQPNDTIFTPPPSIGGHITHHQAGAAGLYHLRVHHAPVCQERYIVDLDALREQAHALKPSLITLGGSLNLFPHPVAEVREIADEVGAYLLFDAAHLCGMIAGGAWANPLTEGAHLMTMSTYKSLGGPPAGLIVTCDDALAQKLDKIAFPGLTANYDAGKAAALAVTLLDWLEHGPAYAQAMVDTASALAEALNTQGVRTYAADKGSTQSHQFAVLAAPYGGGQTAAKRLRHAQLLTCGIGLPLPSVPDDLNGLRLGTPEVARLGMTAADMPKVADFISRALTQEPDKVAPEVSAFRQAFTTLQFIN